MGCTDDAGQPLQIENEAYLLAVRAKSLLHIIVSPEHRTIEVSLQPRTEGHVNHCSQQDCKDADWHDNLQPRGVAKPTDQESSRKEEHNIEYGGDACHYHHPQQDQA